MKWNKNIDEERYCGQMTVLFAVFGEGWHTIERWREKTGTKANANISQMRPHIGLSLRFHLEVIYVPNYAAKKPFNASEAFDWILIISIYI